MQIEERIQELIKAAGQNHNVIQLDEVDQVFDKSLSEQEFDYVIGRLKRPKYRIFGFYSGRPCRHGGS